MTDQRIVEFWLAELAHGSRHRPSPAAQADGGGGESRRAPESTADDEKPPGRGAPTLT